MMYTIPCHTIPSYAIFCCTALYYTAFYDSIPWSEHKLCKTKLDYRTQALNQMTREPKTTTQAWATLRIQEQRTAQGGPIKYKTGIRLQESPGQLHRRETPCSFRKKPVEGRLYKHKTSFR